MRTVTFAVLGLSISASVAAADPLVAPPPEIVKVDVKLDVPPVPSFELAAGPLTVRRLRVAGKPLLGTRVVLHGFVTYAYDCPTAIRKPGETDKAVQARIDADPTVCERPKFYIGDTMATPPDKSLWIVDVPRPYNKLELKNLAKPDRNLPNRCEPNEKDPAKRICPPYSVGDEVIVDGTFDLTSPHSERNSDGLVVYSAMKNITRKWETPGAKLEATMVAVAGTPTAAPKPPPIARTAAKPVDPAKRAESIHRLNDGNRALANQQLDGARDEYRAAIDAWDGNHVAWYGLGTVAARAQKWADAADALEHAVALAPDVAMYRMWLGIVLYEHHRADAARAQLAEAVRLQPEMWRAHYYLGRIAREQERAGDAAEDFTHAVRANPREVAPYIALGELYRRWDYTDQAIQVISQGTQNARPPSSELWLALGLAYLDRRVEAKAIEAFDQALKIDPHNPRALFQRGLAYFHLGDFAHAQHDLEEFVKTAAAMDFEKALSSQILMDIAARSKK